MEEIWRERSKRSVAYFTDTCCWLDVKPGWARFALWPDQRATLPVFRQHKRAIVLKARQLGLSWLVLAEALHEMVFVPGSAVLLFSKGDNEAKELLRRLRGMADRLPSWLGITVTVPSNTQEITLSNGSNAKSFPTTGGRSYTGTLAIIDEGDRFETHADLGALLNAVEPTVDAGGRLILLSTPDKSKPESLFKRMYRAAVEGEGMYFPIFLPWSARPDRDQAWYEAKRRDILARTGSLDDLHQEFPATPTEALAPRSLDKRIPPDWLEACYAAADPCQVPAVWEPKPPAIPGLVVYALPQPGQTFAAGGDPAEGNPTSDDSSADWLNVATGEQVAHLSGKFQPDVFASHVAKVCAWLGNAPVLVERNNHGHAVLLWLRDNARKVRCLVGTDGKPGWMTTTKSKALLFDRTAEAAREREFVIHDFGTLTQMQSIEGATLRAPEGQHDDKAISFALADLATTKAQPAGGRPIVWLSGSGLSAKEQEQLMRARWRRP